jgi:hypothetical protein
MTHPFNELTLVDDALFIIGPLGIPIVYFRQQGFQFRQLTFYHAVLPVTPDGI